MTHSTRAVISPALALCLLAGTRAAAQCERRLGPAQSGFLNGNVNASGTWDPDAAGPLPAMLIVGGSAITRAGLSVTSNIAAYDGTMWMPLGAGVSGGSVFAITTFNNELVVAGNFSTAGGQPVGDIARWNGTSWSGLGVGLNNTVLGLAVFNNALYACGDFTTAGGSPANRIARWDGANWTPLTSGVNGSAEAMTVLAGALYVGGSFSTAGGVAVNNLARWTGSAWQTVGSGIGGPVHTLGVRQTAAGVTTLYVGGQFTSAGGVSANNIVAIASPETIPSYGALGAGLSPYVNKIVARAIGASGTEVTAATPPDGSGHAVWRLAGSAWNALGAMPGLASVDELIFYNNQYVTGLINDPGVYVRFWDTVNLRRAPLGPGINGTVNAAVPFGTDLIVGGFFDYAAGVYLNNIGRWNGTTWTPMAGGVFGTVDALYVDQNELYVGGTFNTTGSGLAPGIAHWNGAGWEAVGPPTGNNGDVFAMTEYQGRFLICRLSPPHVMAWDGASWTAMSNTGLYPFNSGPPGSFGVGTDGTLYLAYNGDLSGGVVSYDPAANRWNGLSGISTGSTGMCFGQTGGTLYTGGALNSSGSPSHKFEIAVISQLSAIVDESVYGVSTQTTQAIQSMASYNGSLYAAGNFDAPTPANSGLLRLGGGVWTAAGNGTASINFGRAMAPYQNELVVAGDLTVAGTQFGHAWARWSCPPACYANCDQSTQAPVLNVGDFTCFLQKFASADAYANCDASTTPPVLNVNDFTCFLQKYAAGCP